MRFFRSRLSKACMPASMLPAFLPSGQKPTFDFGLSDFESFDNDSLRVTLQSVLKQTTRFSPIYSDHLAAISHVDGLKILMFNMMMQCKEKVVNGAIFHNNGFKVIESDRAYEARIDRVMHKLVEILLEHPDINVVALQEAPLKPAHIAIMADIIDKFLPGWHAAQFDMTDFGLMTFIRTEKNQSRFYADEVLANALEGKKNGLSTRCQTFTNGTCYKFSNIHVEHTGSEQSLKVILEALIDDAINKNVALHDIAGDFNSNFFQVKRVLRAVWAAKCKQLKSLDPDHLALKLEARFDASPKGHRKAGGSVIDADGILSLRFRCADGKQNEFSFAGGRLQYSERAVDKLAVMYGGLAGMSVISAATDSGASSPLKLRF